jgi:predicted nuclease of restriction endonuclease-like RecB superfamily
MLSVEHVRAKRDGNRLRLQELPPSKRARVRELALELSEILVASVGDDRDTVESRLSELELRPSERRIALGLAKLLLDEAEFGAHSPVEPAELRRAVFERAASARRAATLEAPFSRDQLIADVAPGFGLSPEAFDEALYADLRGAERLLRAPALDPEHWVTRYEQGQVQAVLLRAVKVVVDVQCAVPDAYRSLFQKLKFRKLMYQSERLSGGGYRLTIDGPYSLFEAVTKYGLELSLLLPALEACDVFELRAEVLWGAQRTPLSFEHRHVRRSRSGEASAVRDEIAQLCQDFEALGSRWQARVSEELLELPGSVVCVPDLSFSHPDDPEPVYFELLGFWSRDAVFRRVEWAERGLGHRIVFGVSSKLRVSESVLEPDTHAALYVFKGKPSARALERKLDALRAP